MCDFGDRDAFAGTAVESAVVWQLDGDVYRLACSLGESPEYRRLLERKTIACASGATAADEIGMVGLVGLEEGVRC